MRRIRALLQQSFIGGRQEDCRSKHLTFSCKKHEAMKARNATGKTLVKDLNLISISISGRPYAYFRNAGQKLNSPLPKEIMAGLPPPCPTPLGVALAPLNVVGTLASMIYQGLTSFVGQYWKDSTNHLGVQLNLDPPHYLEYTLLNDHDSVRLWNGGPLGQGELNPAVSIHIVYCDLLLPTCNTLPVTPLCAPCFHRPD